MATSLQRKVLVITGGTGGVGYAMVQHFAKAGCDVAFSFYSDEEVAKKVVNETEAQHKVKVCAYPLNILKPDQLKEFFRQIDQDFDRVDYFINNAVISGREVVGGFAPFMKLKTKGLERIYTSTITSFVVGVQEAVKRIEKVKGGSIIALSSLGNLGYMANYTGHGSAKAAVEVVVKYAAVEFGPKNISVNALSASAIDTKAFRLFPNYTKAKESFIQNTPMGRLCQTKDLSGIALFLCSQEGRWITGQTIIADGGFLFTRKDFL